jgi:perosamine synthetase
MMNQVGEESLALYGGARSVDLPLVHYQSMNGDEAEAAAAVVRSGVLSAFLGASGEHFLGGPIVRQFEAAWRQRYGVRHAISVNSCTSGLMVAMGAVGITAGDEVIVPPFTMSATVIAPLIYGGIPVFADLDPETCCIDPQSVRKRMTPRTKAIVAVNLWGHPAALTELKRLADECGIWLIEDNAQSPLAEENGRLCGTIGHIGVFSLNYHKHIHTGEGGVCVTEDDSLAERMQLIRNHGENAVEARGIEDITNIVGFNFRLTEIQAAIGLEQLKNIDKHVDVRVRIGSELTEAVGELEGIRAPVVRPGCKHVYYMWMMRYEQEAVGVSRDLFQKALAVEGVPTNGGYLRPLHLLPLFQKRIAFGAYPFKLSQVQYPKGLCPVSERMYERELILFHASAYDLDSDGVHQVARAIRKVHANRHLLATTEPVGTAS